jgi:hypothetical protein
VDRLKNLPKIKINNEPTNVTNIRSSAEPMTVNMNLFRGIKNHSVEMLIEDLPLVNIQGITNLMH